MGSENEFRNRSRKFAQLFLQTAVVVDDEAYMETRRSGGPTGDLVPPGRRAGVSSHEDQSKVDHGSKHSLDAQAIIDSFSMLGVICGVVGPTESAMEVMRQADLVVLDWRLKDDDPEFALKLLQDLVTEEIDRNSLRLVAIYTGEAQLEDICKTVFDKLSNAGLDPDQNEIGTLISYRHGSVVLYAKSDVNLAPSLKERSVAEEDLPGRLVEDFSSMTEGLLPRIALTSLTAVREGAHRVLDRFCADLDPAFLTHRTCITNPDDAERQIVDHVAEELRGLMDSAVAEQSPAGAQAVESWIRRKDQRTEFIFDDRLLNLEETIKLGTKGLIKSDRLSEKYFRHLTAGFAGSNVVDLDERLAWIMSFRTVFNKPPPTLWLGSVVTATMGDNETHLICMRPRCDCVGLKEETSFFFLKLVQPKKGMGNQLVVRFNGKFERLAIEFDPEGWVHRQFKPLEGKQAIIATKREPNDAFEFEDISARRYTWRGELKAEYAQRIVQVFAGTLSRVAIDESDWLRRMARE